MVVLDDKHGFIDLDGKLVVTPQFDRAASFHDGLAAVKLGKRWGFIDKEGKLAINPQFDRALSFSEDRAAVRLGDKWGYVDGQGKLVITPQFESAGYFTDGLAPVEMANRYGFIDRDGKLAINPQFDDAWDCGFVDGRAAVEVADKWGFIDKDGKFTTNPQFDRVRLDSDFFEFLGQKWAFPVPARLERRWGYVDRDGTFVITPQFDDQPTPFLGKLASLNGRSGWIDRSGKAVTPEETDGGAAAAARAAALAEPNEMLDLIKKGAAAYFMTPRTQKDTGIKIDCQFPDQANVTPGGTSASAIHPCCRPENDSDGDHRCDSAPGEWNNPTWSALKFAITDQHSYVYSFESSGVLSAAQYTATAYGDLDCDGTWSTFQLVGRADPTTTRAECQVGTGAIFRDNENE